MHGKFETLIVSSELFEQQEYVWWPKTAIGIFTILQFYFIFYFLFFNSLLFLLLSLFSFNFLNFNSKIRGPGDHFNLLFLQYRAESFHFIY